MKTYCLLVGAVLLLATPADAQIVAGPVVNPANGHSYYLTESNDWFTAESIGVSLGGHLAAINDAAENTWVFNTFSSYGGVERSLWIGLNDLVQEGQFVWTSGESPGYFNWAPPEPNNGGGIFPNEDVVHIWYPGSGFPLGSWVDAQDFLHYNGVVEVVPEPSTLALAGLALLAISSSVSRSRCIRTLAYGQRRSLDVEYRRPI